MRIIDRNGRLFGKISVIDVAVLLVVLALVLAVAVKSQKPEAGGVETSKIVYQMKLQNQPAYIVTALQVGDEMFDYERSSGGSLGTITDIEVSGGTAQATFSDGTVEIVPTAGNRYDVLLTIEGEGIVDSAGNVLLNRIYYLGVNSNRYFNTRYAFYISLITDIQIQAQ